MRPRRCKKSKKPFCFDDYDESEYTLDSDASSTSYRPRNTVAFPKKSSSRKKLDLLPQNAGIQIKISGQIQISLVGDDGERRNLFRFVVNIVCSCDCLLFFLTRVGH